MLVTSKLYVMVSPSAPVPPTAAVFTIEISGAGASSVIVPVPLGSVFVVFPEVTFPFTVNVSVGSPTTSPILGTITVTPV